jgi:hypothetical protein
LTEDRPNILFLKCYVHTSVRDARCSARLNQDSEATYPCSWQGLWWHVHSSTKRSPFCCVTASYLQLWWY